MTTRKTKTHPVPDVLTMIPTHVALLDSTPCKHRALYTAILLLSLAALPAIAYYDMRGHCLGWSEYWPRKYPEIPYVTEFITGMLILFFISIVESWIPFRRERLLLDKDAIHYYSPFGGRLNALKRDWQLPLSEVREARLRRPRHAFWRAAYVLVLSAGHKKKKLQLYSWISPKALDASETADGTRTPYSSALRVDQNDPILVHLRAYGISIKGDPGAAKCPSPDY